LSFAVAAGCLAVIEHRHRDGPGAASDKPRHTAAPVRIVHDAREGFREVLRHRWLWVLILQALVYHLFFGGVQAVIGPIVVKRSYGEAQWGWTLAALLFGFVVGGLVTLRVRPRRLLLGGVLCLALTGALPAALALNRALLLVLLGAFVHGLGLQIFDVNWDLAIQQNVAPDRLSRVFAVDTIGSYVMRPLGLLLTGPVAEAVGFSRWLWIVTAVVTGSSLAAVVGVPSVRNLQRA
jgi:MFS family permease